MDSNKNAAARRQRHAANARAAHRLAALVLAEANRTGYQIPDGKVKCLSVDVVANHYLQITVSRQRDEGYSR